MKRLNTKMTGIFTLLLLLVPHPAVSDNATAATNRAKEILRQIDDMWRGESSYAVLTMRVKTAHYERTVELEGWSKGKEKTLIRILRPLKEKGAATLKFGNHIYSYLPKTDRTIRLTSSMMMGSWMGSHFTNDDLVKESRMEEDYNPVISFEGKRDDIEIIEFTLMPKPEAAVVWGKVVMAVTTKDYLPIKQDYYDEDLEVVRTMLFTEVKLLSGKQRPSVMRVVPINKHGEYTELIYKTLQLNVPMQDDFFSLSQLKKR